MTTASPPKGRVLTATELALAEGLSKALIGKATAEATLDVCRHEIGRLTREINRLGFDAETGKTDSRRPGLVWAEAREQMDLPPASRWTCRPPQRANN